ncbi:MAG: hypothetical protein NTY64_18430 [Deltaproteobacteria bacterium]|nr:hypothetical protein [Deltaproteobacteria bacterium]
MAERFWATARGPTKAMGKESKNDDFVKSPSVPLGAGLHFTFVVAAYLVSTPRSSVPLGAGLRAFSRETRESFLRNQRFGDFLRDHQK